MLVLGRSQVESLLDLDTLIDAFVSAMGDLSADHASAPPASPHWCPSMRPSLRRCPAS